MLIGADNFLHAAHTFRNVWLRGRYGGGKTLLSICIADKLAVRYGYSVYSNIPVHLETVIDKLGFCDGTGPVCDDSCLEKIEYSGQGKYHTVVVYDEAWLGLGQGTSPKQIKRYLAYLRKLDVVMLMPSVLDLARNSYLLWVERLYNFGSLGIPVWLYAWGLPRKSAKVSGGYFWLIRPQSFFGKYDTNAQPEELPDIFEGV